MAKLVQTRLPDALFVKLRAAAKKQERSVAATVRWILGHILDGREVRMDKRGLVAELWEDAKKK